MIVIQKVQSLIERVGTGVCKVTAVKIKTALPVPTSCEAVELNTDMNDSAKLARRDNFLYLFEVMREAALLEYQKLKILAFCDRNKNIVFFNGGNEGLFAKHVKAVL